MTAMTDFLENRLTDALFRGGAVNTSGAVNSTAVVKGLWAATTAYVLGDIVVPVANTSAGGKFLICTTAGTSGGTFTTALGNPGATVSDNTVTWTIMSGMPSPVNLYVGLFTANPSDTGGGTEVTGNAYARVAVASSMANWAGTQAAASTTASTGTSGTTSNNGVITFPTPTPSGWGTVTGMAIFDQLTGGNMLIWSALTTSKTINAGDSVTFPAAALTFQVDN